jgi:putative spermidine/putrescine transport system ATP-binding protein
VFTSVQKRVSVDDAVKTAKAAATRGRESVPGEPVIVRLREVRKLYKGTVAVDQVSLDVHTGEFFTLLGPSGSGKTTTLRLIAGFEKPDSGHIELNGTDVTHFPPFARDINTVFQDYALFPHMNVESNVAYGLEAKGVALAERGERVAKALRMVRLESLGARMPAQLSGGQRQRVALARAIVNRPQVLLLDEPLGALDLKLREEMQSELKRIQEEIGITFLYVTHDQDEALTMSDRIAVFNRGQILQIGTPMEIYGRPSNSFVARFVGISNMIERSGRCLVIRPEKIQLLEPGAEIAPDFHVEVGVLTESVFVGMFNRHRVMLGDGSSVTVVELNSDDGSCRRPAGQPVRVAWRQDHAFVLKNNC